MQTGSILGDLLSILFSLGSPVWICSSIAHSVLFRRAIHKRLEKLRVDAISNQSGHDVAPFIEQCDAAETILQSFLQAPIRLSTRPGFLSSLIVLPQNHGWWPTTAAKIETGHRRIDAPYIGQNMIAVITWLLSILVDFESIPGSIPGNSGSAEWQICMGTLFLWLVSNFSTLLIHGKKYTGSLVHAKRTVDSS